MRNAGESDLLTASGEVPQMLVLGYRKTLQPEFGPGCMSAGAADHSADGPGDSGAVPPQMEVLTERWLAKAKRELEWQIPEEQRVFHGERIPFEDLLEGLRQRLLDILTLVVGAHLERGDGTATLTESDLKRDFPWLAWLAGQSVSEWVTATVTFFRRLERDRRRLAEWMGVASVPRVESVCGTAADTHPGGHAVLRVVLEGGRCVYYKPRSVTGEWLWHKLLESIAAFEPRLRLQAGRVLDGSVPGRYGWMESVRPEDLAWNGVDDCAGDAGYWHAAGAMLCLAYHAALTDLHLGNVMATPRGPVVTDAECLGTPGTLETSISSRSGAARDAGRFLELLLETGLLPGRLSGDMPDVSGLFGRAGPVPKLRLPWWRQGAGGGYRLAAARANLRDHGNAPAGLRPLSVLPDLLAGYREAAGVLLRAREALMEPGTLWRSVLEHEHAPRIVVRDTLTYGLLLSRSLEPGQLGAGYLRRSGLLRALQREGPGDCPASVRRAELHALLCLHVPRLILQAGTRTLASHAGRPLVRNFVQCTPVGEVFRRLAALSGDSVEQVQIPALLMAMFGARKCTEPG